LFGKKNRNAGGYSPPPWKFRGRALYQLHPVKVSVAEQFVPEDVNLVQFGGYTLGGWYLANYTDSPASDNKNFGELVAIAGLVWNPPTSCAWASHVYVGSKSAKAHGEKEVGLPEYFARFEARSQARNRSFWNLFRPARRPEVAVSCGRKEIFCVEVPKQRTGWRAGFPVSMRLPSFSGYNRWQPNLMNYWLDLKGKLSLVYPPCKVKVSKSSPIHDLVSRKPWICMCFENLSMDVDPPVRFDASSTFKNVPFKFLQKRSTKQQQQGQQSTRRWWGGANNNAGNNKAEQNSRKKK